MVDPDQLKSCRLNSQNVLQPIEPPRDSPVLTNKMVQAMTTRRPTFFILACLLLATGLNTGWSDSRGRAAARETEGTTATREISSAQEKRAAVMSHGKQSFIKLVGEKFAAWDQNRDGRLSPDEIDRLIADPQVVGLEAAAVASIHRYLRADGAPSAITQRELQTEAQQQPLLPEQGKNGEPLRQDLNDGKPRFVTFYTYFALHLKKAPRDLFTSDQGPTLEGIKQGSLGDCFFMCVIGATVNRDPQSIRKMLHANPDGTTDVKFPGSRRVRVPRLTDSEIALTSSAEDQGIWVNVLEKAFGTVKYAQPKTQHSDDEIDLDVISRGGKILSTIQLMTGHKAFAITIRQYKSKKYHLPTRADMPRMLARLDSAFSKAFASNRLVCADIAPGINGKDIPPGLSGRHAYAVLGYDPATHIVTVWNPHGKDYKPKASPPNPTNGYTVKKGVFEIPLKDFVRVFKAVTYETSASLTAAANPKRRRGGA
jgi:Calpain family cysteine protease